MVGLTATYRGPGSESGGVQCPDHILRPLLSLVADDQLGSAAGDLEMEMEFAMVSGCWRVVN